MSALDELSKNELKEFLLKGWMTHDGMWFYNTFLEFGAESASKMNSAAIRSMAPIELKRLKKALGVETVSSFNELQEFTERAFELIGADFMRFTRSVPEKNIYRWDAEPGRCFAYEGVKGMGAIDKYDCGIFVRVEGWFNALGLDFQVTPKVEGCMMHQQGNCYREYKFSF